MAKISVLLHVYDLPSNDNQIKDDMLGAWPGEGLGGRGRLGFSSEASAAPAGRLGSLLFAQRLVETGEPAAYRERSKQGARATG